MAKEIVIPEGVVNIQAYKRFLALEKQSILNNPIVEASDGTQVNVSMMPFHLAKKIAHLSLKERTYFLDLKDRWFSANGKRNAARKEAFGVAGRGGGKIGEVKKTVDDAVAAKEDIKRLLSKMFTVPEVIKVLGEEYGINVREEEVKRVLRDNIVEIEKARERFREEVTDVRLYNKRPRLEELAWMYGKVRTRYNVNNGDLKSYEAMLKTLEQIRKEAEGDTINIQAAVDVSVDMEINAHIRKDVFQTINLREVILGRVAARMNLDLPKMIASLHNSYYASFCGVLEDTLDEDAEMVYPSTLNYDFNEIERKAKATATDMTPDDLSQAKKDQAKNIKEMFLARVRKQKEDLEKRDQGLRIVEKYERDSTPKD